MDSTTALVTAAYIFPTLKNSEILQCLHELGIEINKSELQEPSKHKGKLRQVFVHLLYLCSGKAEEDFQQTAAVSSELAAFPELHDANFDEWNFFEALQQLMTSCGYHEFSWRDLHYPEAKRLRLQLSAVINLAKFRQEQLAVYAELNAPRAELLATLEELNEENAQLLAQLEQTEQDSEVKGQEMQKVIQECEELEIEIARNNKLQSTAREDAAALKKEANELADQLTTATWALEEAVAEEESLRSKIVTSPDRRRAQVAHRRQEVNQIKDEARRLEKELSDNKGMAMRADSLIHDVVAATKKVGELNGKLSQHKELQDKLKSSRDELESAGKRHSDTKEALVLAERELNRVQKMAVNHKQQQALQHKATQEALDSAKSALLQVEKDRRQDMARVQAGEAEVQQLHTMLEKKRSEMDAVHQSMRNELEQTAQMYLDRLEERCRAFNMHVVDENQ